ncbi:MAG: hypothetical protein WCE54_08675 [Ignavibacteriaceae bacterium]
MKKIFLVLVQFFCSINILSQPSFNLFSGYGKTVFDNAVNQAEYLPAGVQLMFGVPVFNFGIEANYNLTPIIYEVLDIQSKKKLKQIKFNQFFIGSVIKINLAAGNFIPYLRIGAGLYTGKERVTWYEESKRTAYDNGIILKDYKASLKNRLGVNLGGGFNIEIWRYSGFFLEYVYHFISRQEDVPGSALFKADNWIFSFGYQINFL